MKDWVEMYEESATSNGTDELHAGQHPGKGDSAGVSPPNDPGEKKPTNGLKPWSPKRLRQRHKLAIRLEACGMTNNQIAEHLGYTPSRISIILNDPRADEIRAGMSSLVADNLDDIALRLQHYAGEALTEVVDIMRESTSDTVRQRSAFDILDRAGYNKIEKHISATTNISDKQVAQLLGTLEETKQVFDADYTVEDS